MPWKSLGPGDFPTLGWLVADQMAAYLGRPDAGDDEQHEPFIVTREQQDALNEIYRLDRRTCKRVVHRAAIMKPRGWGKSPFVGAIMIAEAMFDVVPVGWDAQGQPVAAPWSRFRTPYVAVAAVTEEQTRNTWDPILEMLRNGSAPDVFGCDPMDTFVALDRGSIRQITSSPNSAKGGPVIAASLDQTETWVASNHGVKLAQTLRNNVTKRGGVTIETPNAFMIGEGSVAERSMQFWNKLQSSKGNATERRMVFFDQRPTPNVDIDNHDDLIRGLRIAYGDSSKDPRGCVLHDPPCRPGWVDLERIARDFRDESNDRQMMRADFLNLPVLPVEPVTGSTVLPRWSELAKPVRAGLPLGLGVASDPDGTWLSFGAAIEGEPLHLGLLIRLPISKRRAFLDEVVRVTQKYGTSVVIDKGGPASFLIPEMERLSVPLEPIGTDRYVSACADLVAAVDAAEVEHGGYPDLDAATVAAGWRFIADRRVFARKSGDISALESVALAHHGAMFSVPVSDWMSTFG